jgi:hypothetical protein
MDVVPASAVLALETTLMTTIEVSAIYKADRDGFHRDDEAKAIFEAHGGEWTDQGTIYGCGEMHLDRNLTYLVSVEQVGTVKAALEAAGFRVTINAPTTMEEFLEMFDSPYNPETWEFMKRGLSTILNYAATFYDDHDEDVAWSAMEIAAKIVKADGLDEGTAKALISDIGELAQFMLEADGAGGWDPALRARLEAIKDSNPDLAEPATTTAE